MKKDDFDMKNASYVLKLGFSLNDTKLLKSFIQTSNVIRIRATNLILMSKNTMRAWTCKKWNFEIDFDFSRLDDVKERFDRNYLECESDNYDKDDDKNEKGADSIFFTEIFFFNLLSFALNFSMTIFILNVVIEIFKYRALKAQKKSKYRWLLRNKKNFEHKVPKF
jgi:hypothetical protein